MIKNIYTIYPSRILKYETELSCYPTYDVQKEIVWFLSNLVSEHWFLTEQSSILFLIYNKVLFQLKQFCFHENDIKRER